MKRETADAIASTMLATWIGSLLAGAVLGGYVAHETAAPDHNPASQQILIYGD